MIRHKIRIIISTTAFQPVLEALDGAIAQNKETKDITTGKEEIKFSLFSDDLIL
jgi:hypothetical protein